MRLGMLTQPLELRLVLVEQPAQVLGYFAHIQPAGAIAQNSLHTVIAGDKDIARITFGIEHIVVGQTGIMRRGLDMGKTQGYIRRFEHAPGSRGEETCRMLQGGIGIDRGCTHIQAWQDKGSRQNQFKVNMLHNTRYF